VRINLGEIVLSEVITEILSANVALGAIAEVIAEKNKTFGELLSASGADLRKRRLRYCDPPAIGELIVLVP
jgi:hypothetical protein